jgi:hypothetical protein
VTKTAHHEVHAAALNPCKSRTTIHRHRAATANHGTVVGKPGMSREASRGSAATLPPRQRREERSAQGRNCQPATHSNIITLRLVSFTKTAKMGMLRASDDFMKLCPSRSWRCWILVFLVASATAQVTPSPAPAASGPPVPYASVSQLNLLLSQLEQVAQTTQVDLAKLRIEKWKTDSNTKRDTQSDVDSIDRNLQMALPEIIGQLRASPENLAATFKLYHNLDALYDVLGPVVESAGAFGSKDEFQTVQNDLSALERSRRAMAERMDILATAKEGELTQLRTQVRDLQAAAPAAPVPAKKVVVDDTEPPKKPVKKKTATKSTKPSTPATTPKPSTTTSSQPAAQQPQTQPQP